MKTIPSNALLIILFITFLLLLSNLFTNNRTFSLFSPKMRRFYQSDLKLSYIVLFSCMNKKKSIFWKQLKLHVDNFVLFFMYVYGKLGRCRKLKKLFFLSTFSYHLTLFAFSLVRQHLINMWRNKIDDETSVVYNK